VPLEEMDDVTPEDQAFLEKVVASDKLFREFVVKDHLARRRRCAEHHRRLGRLERWRLHWAAVSATIGAGLAIFGDRLFGGGKG